MELSVIYDGVLDPSAFNLSEMFRNAQFLYFSAGNNFNYELEIGVSLVVFAPTIGGGEQAKLAADLGVLNSNQIIPLTREVSESGLDYQLAFGVDTSVPGFRAYVWTSEVTQEGLAEAIAQLQENALDILENQATQLATQLAIGANQIAQNQALALIGTGLIPLTAGVTAPVPLILEGSSLLLLPGI
ncbi:hypothetical protein IQE94_05480 [Synechocystis sp. PCC 7339]|uniref:hypothetical protein n=1 Tax=Synechocystis sp. PCC 7339 TaxID=2782213 RepID=UPI001CBD7A47|nr:hypothetical protein [Synechocystis sp. PCC 7339]UAJ73733.1 hypothetical protein IQE94_05480 [Synechocystis sp. PCC 7339]